MGSKRKKYFDDYDFEEAYQKSIEDMEQDQIDRYVKQKKGIGYQTKTTKAGDHLEADIYPIFGNRQDAPRTKRGNASRTKEPERQKGASSSEQSCQCELRGRGSMVYVHIRQRTPSVRHGRSRQGIHELYPQDQPEKKESRKGKCEIYLRDGI